jgi:predicted methyltransferase
MLAACGSAENAANKVKDAASETGAAVTDAAKNAAMAAKDEAAMAANKAKLAAVLAAQDNKAKARYQYRRPAKTLDFLGIAPGMKVAEALPGGGWYSKILIPYLGDEGALTGIDYAMDMWSEFSFMTPERIEAKKTWPADWTAGAQDWRGGSEAEIGAFTFGARDTTQDGSYDAVLFIRAMHNLSRFEANGGYMTQAIADTHALLKSGGIVGVVQHAGPESNSDEWATGSNGYLKKSAVIAAFTAAGFELVGDSDINANPADVPSETEGVWRLPPSLSGSKDNPEMAEKMKAIGESNRMTLKFVKL